MLSSVTNPSLATSASATISVSFRLMTPRRSPFRCPHRRWQRRLWRTSNVPIQSVPRCFICFLALYLPSFPHFLSPLPQSVFLPDVTEQLCCPPSSEQQQKIIFHITITSSYVKSPPLIVLTVIPFSTKYVATIWSELQQLPFLTSTAGTHSVERPHIIWHLSRHPTSSPMFSVLQESRYPPTSTSSSVPC